MNTQAERTTALLDSHRRDRDLQWLIHQQRCRADALLAAVRRSQGKVYSAADIFDLAETYARFIMSGERPQELPR